MAKCERGGPLGDVTLSMKIKLEMSATEALASPLVGQ
jgi:hypothetical protein